MKTEVSQTMPRLRADGVTLSVTVRLRDIDGNAITTGLPISVNAKSGQGNIVTVEDLVDNGAGPSPLTSRPRR